MNRLPYLLSLPFLVLLLLNSAPEVNSTVDNEPVISKTTLPAFSKGTASGDNLMQYRGFTVSYVLGELSDVPVAYTLDEDPRIDFNYHYPDLSTAEAKVVAVTALAEFVGARVEEVRDPDAGFYVEATSEFGKKSPEALDLAGVRKQVLNDQIAAANLSLSELTDLLNEYREERFVAPEQDKCCATVRFTVDSDPEELKKSVLESAGVHLRSNAGVITGLRIIR